jgi:hypothetical protein
VDAAGISRLSILSGIVSPLLKSIIGQQAIIFAGGAHPSPDAFKSANVQFQPALRCACRLSAGPMGSRTSG